MFSVFLTVYTDFDILVHSVSTLDRNYFIVSL